MRVFVDFDEVFPFYFASDKKIYGSLSVDISEEEYKEIDRIQKEFEKLQEKLKELFDKAK